LLAGIAQQEFRKNSKPEIHLYIVDNDAEGSARAVCDEMAEQESLAITYGIETQRGIPFARNNAVDRAKGNCDYIAIMDDDEVPDTFWLDELLAALIGYDADIVTGPVYPHFVTEPPAWIRSFYGSGELADGTDLRDNYDYVYTSNLLAKECLFHEARFDERFKMNGADDTHLFIQLNKAGRKIAWANLAKVTEWMPESRVTAKWLWQRAYRLGNGFAFCELVEGAGFKGRTLRCLKGLARVGQGAIGVVLSLGRKAAFVRGVQTACRGMGMVLGSLGTQHQEYKKIHGS